MGLDRLVDFGKDLIDFERTNLREMGRKLKEDPERALIGAIDPFSSDVWGKVLGKDYEPMLNQWGGPDASTWQRAQAEGVNLEPSEIMHGIAQSIAQMYAGNYGADQVRAFGQSQGWNPEYVDAGIQAAEQGVSAQQQSNAPPVEVTEGLHPPRPPQPAFQPPAPEQTFGPGQVATASGAPGQAFVPGAIPTFHGPVPTPPTQPRRA